MQVEGADGRTQIEQAGGCGGFGKGNFTALFKSIEVIIVMRLFDLRLGSRALTIKSQSENWVVCCLQEYERTLDI
jgi:hypothetical protein